MDKSFARTTDGRMQERVQEYSPQEWLKFENFLSRDRFDHLRLGIFIGFLSQRRVDFDQGPTSEGATDSFALVQMIQVVVTHGDILKLPRRSVKVDEARAEFRQESFTRSTGGNLRNEQFGRGHRVVF